MLMRIGSRPTHQRPGQRRAVAGVLAGLDDTRHDRATIEEAQADLPAAGLAPGNHQGRMASASSKALRYHRSVESTLMAAVLVTANRLRVLLKRERAELEMNSCRPRSRFSAEDDSVGAQSEFRQIDAEDVRVVLVIRM